MLSKTCPSGTTNIMATVLAELPCMLVIIAFVCTAIWLCTAKCIIRTLLPGNRHMVIIRDEFHSKLSSYR